MANPAEWTEMKIATWMLHPWSSILQLYPVSAFLDCITGEWSCLQTWQTGPHSNCIRHFGKKTNFSSMSLWMNFNSGNVILLFLFISWLGLFLTHQHFTLFLFILKAWLKWPLKCIGCLFATCIFTLLFWSSCCYAKYFSLYLRSTY